MVGGEDLHWVGKDPNISLGWGYVPLTLIVFIEISSVSGNCMSEFMGLIYGSYEAKVDMSCLFTFRRKVVSEDIFGSVGLK